MDAAHTLRHAAHAIEPKEASMDVDALVDRYIAAWNEPDADARRSAVADVWVEDGRYVDPLADVTGHTAISDLIGAVQAQAPGHVFQLLDSPDGHHDFVRFGWALVPESGGEPLAVGRDVARTREDGRFGGVVGFLDKAPIG
jgi:SnoaL-like domain